MRNCVCFAASSGAFPPPVTKGQKPWRLKFRGYQHDDILTQTVKTDAEGAAQFNFTPEREGYYRVAWQSSQGMPHRASATASCRRSKRKPMSSSPPMPRPNLAIARRARDHRR